MSQKIVSLTHKIWNIYSTDTVHKKEDDIVKTLLNNRGFYEMEEFTKASIRSCMPDPFLFIDMEKAVNRIVSAIQQNEKIAIIGDYDVDGISSTAILVKFLEHIDAEFTYIIPNRMDDGYGISLEIIEKYKDYLIISVDCGSSAIDELKYAKENNIDVIVIDHHKMSSIPESAAIVNPHRSDEQDTYKNLCATGLVFIYVVGINRSLNQIGFYNNKKIKEPELIDYLDLVAMATVCDVMELVGLNRAFVSTGIKVMQKRKNLGIDALIAINKSSIITSDTIAFFFGPRLNSAGRMSSADISVKLLTTKNPIEAKNLALQLDSLNKQRQEIESEITTEAMQFVDENLNFICSYSNKWHIGIIGIVAGRLKEKYNKPTIIISIDENGNGRASCRSVNGIDIAALINKGIQNGIITSGGGHSMAAGFSIKIDKINDLIEFLKSEIHCENTPNELYADCFLPLNHISMDIMQKISMLEPFGAGNRHPKFIIPNVKITSTRQVGKNHIQLLLEDYKNNSLKAISFKSFNTQLGNIIMNNKQTIDVLGSLTISEWNGKKQINFHLEDIAASINQSY